MSAQPEQFESLYRIVGLGDRGKRMAMYDVNRDDTVWVNTTGYDDDMHDTLASLEIGNLVDATVVHEDGDDYWNIADISREYDSVVFYAMTDGYTVGPTDDFWAEKDPDSSHVSVAKRVQETDQILYELQLQNETVVDEHNERHDVFDALQRGVLLLDPFFDGQSCDYLDSAKAIIVVDPQPKEYVAMYMFEERTERFEEMWEEFDQRMADLAE